MAGQDRETSRDREVDTTSESRRDVFLAELSALVARMLRTTIEEIDPRVPFLEMGADSLVLTEIVRVIQTTYGLKLSIRQFFEETTTIEALAQRMDESLPRAKPTTSDVVPKGEPSPARDRASTGPARSASTNGTNPNGTQLIGASANAFETPEQVVQEGFAEMASTAHAPSSSARASRSSSPSADGVATIFSQQLQLVSQLITRQLAVLGGQGAALPRDSNIAAPASALAREARVATPPSSSLTNPAVTPRRDVDAPKTAPKAVPASTVQAPSRGLDERQQKHLDALVHRYTQRTRRSKELAERHRSSLADSRATVGFRFSTKEMLYPIVGQRAEGARIWDVDGNEYVDVTMGFGVHLFGNRPAFVDDALRDEIANGVDLGPRSRLAGEVAELLCELTGHERVTFCNSGTEAVMTAIRLARARTGRSRIVIFTGSYHGHSDGTLAERNVGGGLFDSSPIAPGIPEGVASDVLVLDYGSDEALSVLRQHGASVAAVLVEPVQSRHPSLQPEAFLRELRAVTRETGTALIFDEMITGFRVHPGGAQALFGVKADIAAYGKIVGGGMPIGVVAGSAAFMNGIDGGPWQYGDRSYPKEEMTFFGGTFCQHPLAMAAARAVLLRLRAEGPALQRDLNERTAEFARAANERFGKFRAPVKVEHFGSLFRFGCAGNMDLLFYHLLERGVYIWEWRCCFLSTAHTAADTTFVLDAIGGTLGELEKSGLLDDAAPRPPDSPLSGRSSPAALGSRVTVGASISNRHAAQGARASNGDVTRDASASSNGHAAQGTVSNGHAAPGSTSNGHAAHDAVTSNGDAVRGAPPSNGHATRGGHVIESVRGVPEFVGRRRGTASLRDVSPIASPTALRRPLEFSLSFFGKYEAEFRDDKYDLLFESCRWADDRGFAAVWLPERHFHSFGGLCPNPSVLASALARTTKKLGLRAGSVVLPLHNPIRVAEEWAMVDNLSQGRVGIAFASGWHPDDFALAPDKYGKHREITFRDADVVRRLWRGETVSVLGGAGNAIDVRLHPLPAQRELPTWLTIVNNPETYAKAGELGVGVLTNLMGQTHEDLARNIACYREALEKHGWPAERGHVTALLHSFVGARDDEARAVARRPFGAYLQSSIGLFRNLMKSEKLDVDFDDLTADDREYICDKAFERYLDSAILVGAPDSCESVARRLHAVGVDEIAAFVDFGVEDRAVLGNLGHLAELREQCRRAVDESSPRIDIPSVHGAPSAASTDELRAGDRLPLLATQAQMWVLGQISEEGATAYTDLVALQLDGPLNLGAIEDAFATLVARHDALRLHMSEDGREQILAENVRVEVPVVDVDGDAARAWLKERTREPIDLHAAPALDVHLLRTAPERHVLSLRAHHAFVDGWSLGNLVGELGQLYSAACRGERVELPPAPGFGDFVRRQQETLASERGQNDEAYWLAKLSGPLPSIALPTDRPRPSRLSFAGARETVRLDARLVRTVQDLSRQSGCTPFMTFLAVYVLWLRHLCRQNDVLVGVAVANRPPEDGDLLVGSMSQLLPLRFNEPRDVAFPDFLRAVRAGVLEGFEHPDYAYARLVEKLGGGRDLSRAPLTSVVFNYDRPLQVASFGDLGVQALPREIGFARYDLYLNVSTIDGQIDLECDYNADLFDAASIRRYLAGYARLIEQLGEDATQRLSSYAPVTREDVERMLVEWNTTLRGDESPGSPVHRQIESWARKAPEAAAVVVDADLAEGSAVPARSWTFADLERRANAVAAALHARGVGAEDRVAIMAPRSPELVSAVLGVLKVGAAFVPLDPAYPVDRLAFMMKDAEVRFALAADLHAPIVASLGVEAIVLGAPNLEAGDVPSPDVCVTPDQLAYVMYTSGSTGRPKGVMVSHRGLADYIRWCGEVYPIADSDGAPLHGSIAFDATLTSLFAPLCHGRAVFVVPDDQEIQGLVRALGAKRRYGFVKLTPSHLALLHELGADDALAESAAAIILGGEALSGAVLAPWKERASSPRIFNEYGPTEAVVGCALAEGRDVLPLSQAASIGKPATSTQLYVLDEQLGLVAPGVVGELYIAGPCVARGYNRAPALTAERFLPNPFAGRTPGVTAGDRIYKTGDLARFLADGTLELFGRADDQIKIRGFRIELGEIAAVLSGHPRVQNAVALVRNQSLVAYVCSDAADGTGEGALCEELRERAKDILPAHMVPADFVVLHSFPLTAHGKIDTSRLPTVQRQNPQAEDAERAPRTEIESSIAAMWCELLDLPHVGIHQNFFDLGGHSSLVVRVHQRIAEQFGKSIPVVEMFRRPTVAALATFLATSGSEAGAPLAGGEGDARASARKSALAGLRGRTERGRA